MKRSDYITKSEYAEMVRDGNRHRRATDAFILKYGEDAGMARAQRIADGRILESDWLPEKEIKELLAKAKAKNGHKSQSQRNASELRGYLLGLEDGYVQAKFDPTGDHNTLMEKFDELCQEAEQFADEKGKQFYEDYVVGVNYEADGSRSRGWMPGTRKKGFKVQSHGSAPTGPTTAVAAVKVRD